MTINPNLLKFRDRKFIQVRDESVEVFNQSNLISHFVVLGGRSGVGFGDVAQNSATNNCAVSQGFYGEEVSSFGWSPYDQVVGTYGLTEIPATALLK